MKIGLVGFPGSGKSAVFGALTGLAVETGFGSRRDKTNLGVVKVPDARVDALAAIYQPKKTTYAEIAFTDLPAAGGAGIERTALNAMRSFEALCQVVRGFADPAGAPPEPLREIADLETETIATPVLPSTSSRRQAAQITQLGPYSIIKELGRGGMGVVYKAKDLRLNREVALKRLPENLRDHPKAIQLFLREAQACARLNHRNIVTIFDTDQDDNNFFITMELLQGYPLNVIRRKRGRIAVRDAARLGMQVAEGLHYAHTQGIVHRDIKTANLFFTTDKVVKIMDFGLAKMMEEVRRGTTVLGGTPYYMAPEQAQGGAVDQRADIYAFGVTLYELLTGSLPFPSGDVTYHHRHSAPPDPRTKVSGLPMALVELILSMMEKKPEDRCSSATEVRTRLKELL